MSVYFAESKLWRLVVTDLWSRPITMLDRLASDRSLTQTLGAPSEFRFRVPAGDPRVNILHTDGRPYLDEGTRLLYAFRREDPGNTADDPWVIRFAGLIMQLEDATRTEDGQTTVVARDPWGYLFNRPCRAIDRNEKTGLIGADGLVYENTTPATIIREQIGLTTTVFGATPSYPVITGDPWDVYLIDGTLDYNLPVIDYDIQQGQSVGQLMQELVGYGTCDVWIDPIYDPVTYPGILGTLNVTAKKGEYRPDALFSWDMPGRSLVEVSRLLDGARRANVIRYFASQGGAGGINVPAGEDTNSQSTFGIYEEQKFFPDVNRPMMYATLQRLAQQEVDFRKDGQVTLSISPAPERSPVPFQEYELGDWMPVYWSNALRQRQVLTMRLVGITLEISDDALETVRELLVVVSDVDQPPGYPGGSYLVGTGGVGSEFGTSGGSATAGGGPAGGGGATPAVGAGSSGSGAKTTRRGTTSGIIRPFSRGPR
jgi:hypothetical protein